MPEKLADTPRLRINLLKYLQERVSPDGSIIWTNVDLIPARPDLPPYLKITLYYLERWGLVERQEVNGTQFVRITPKGRQAIETGRVSHHSRIVDHVKLDAEAYADMQDIARELGISFRGLIRGIASRKAVFIRWYKHMEEQK